MVVKKQSPINSQCVCFYNPVTGAVAVEDEDEEEEGLSFYQIESHDM
jgi:hypothetical protein